MGPPHRTKRTKRSDVTPRVQTPPPPSGPVQPADSRALSGLMGQIGGLRPDILHLICRLDIGDPNWRGNDGQRSNCPAVAETFRKHLRGGIRWALGTTGNQTKPEMRNKRSRKSPPRQPEEPGRGGKRTAFGRQETPDSTARRKVAVVGRTRAAPSRWGDVVLVTSVPFEFAVAFAGRGRDRSLENRTSHSRGSHALEHAGAHLVMEDQCARPGHLDGDL